MERIIRWLMNICVAG